MHSTSSQPSITIATTEQLPRHGNLPSQQHHIFLCHSLHASAYASSSYRFQLPEDWRMQFSSLTTFNAQLLPNTFLSISQRTTEQRHWIRNGGDESPSKKRIANLCVRRRQNVSFPTHLEFTVERKPLSEFLRQPAGMEAMLNTNSLQSYEYLGSNVFRCTLPKLEVLNFEVSPVVDLSVITNDHKCTVEMLSCKFQGSTAVESQNEHFSATMRNQLTWDSSSLEVNVELNVSLEVYTLPFKLLPLATVETPGNIILQAMVDQMVPLFLNHLLEQYYSWAQSADTKFITDGDFHHLELSKLEVLTGVPTNQGQM